MARISMKFVIYPYRIRIDDTEHLLLWMTNGKDQFKVGKNGRLLVARNRRDATRRLETDASFVRWNESGFLSFNTFWNSVNSLRPNRKSRVATCQRLLE